MSEKEICMRFDVSRTPVREALRRLQEQGFVYSKPYSGTYVTLLNLKSIRDMIYMRTAVEWMVIRDFMKIATPILYEEVRHQIRLQELMIQEPDFEPEVFFDMDSKLHALWFGATDKMSLWDFIQTQQVHYIRFRMLNLAMETDFMHIVREHELLFERIRSNDEAGTEALLKQHLCVGADRINCALESEYRKYFEEERPI